MSNRIHLKANGKINWALNITGILPDGYHSLNMVVQRISLADDVYLESADELILTVENAANIPVDENNLVMKAAKALQQHAGIQKGARIHLVKNIPSQAGLGGGSADAAAVLQGLNQLWQTGYSLEELTVLGLPLGADIPLCLRPGLMRAAGKGELITQYPCDLAHHLLIVQPQGGLSTAQVFKRYDKMPDIKSANLHMALQAIQAGDIAAMSKFCHNQLQTTANGLLPDIDAVIADLYAKGAGFAQMSGSGSAVFGVFSSEEQAMKAQQALEMRWPICLYTTTQ